MVLAALCAVTSVGGELADRVEADFKDAPKAAFRHYAVPAMSTVQRLPDAYPWDGAAGAPVRIVAAKGEFEPGSFVVWGEKDLGKVAFSVGELRTVDGKVFPAANLDLKFVKCWYQNGNAWFSYFGDTGFKLVPELLVNDEDLIRTDHEKKANYAKLQEADGTVREQWINPPRQFDQRFVNVSYRKASTFQSMRPNFHDAKTLQPVTIPKGEFRQFLLTAHVTKEIPTGLYRGGVKAKGKGEQWSVPVEIRVCDFELPYPRTYNHPEKEFLVSSYAYTSISHAKEYNGGDTRLAKKQIFEVYRDMANHNQPMLIFGGGPDVTREKVETLDRMQRAGMSTDFLTGFAQPIRNGNAPHDQLDAQAQDITTKLDILLGHHNVYLTFGDEPGWKWLYPSRGVFPIFQKYGLKFYIAGSESVFHRDGYLYDWHNFNDSPESRRSAELLKNWQPLADTYVGWYANHHVGTEDPAFNRRQNGLAAYLAGYSCLCNYAHHFGPYNDDTSGYKPMVFAYGTGDGVLDTLQWEGFREGVDDIRYATLMCSLARNAKKSNDIETRYLGGKALQFMGEQDGATLDMDAVRGDMVRYIEALLAKGVKPETLPSMKPSKRITKEAVDKVLAGPKPDDAKELFLSFAYGNMDFDRAAEPARRLLAAGAKGPNLDLVLALLVAEPALVKDRLDELLVGKAANPRMAIGNVASRLVSENHILLYQRKFDAWKTLYQWAKAKMPDMKMKPSVDLALRAAYAYGITGNDAGLKREIEWVLAENPEAKPVQVFAARAFVAVAEAKPGLLSFGGRRAAVAKALKALEADCAKGVASKDLATALGQVGALFSERCDEEAVRGLNDYRLSLLAEKPKKTYVVRFSDRELEGPAGWDRLGFTPEKAVFDRNYGTSQDFLATDVTTGARVAAKEGEKLDEKPYMEVVADAWGLHFRYTLRDPKAMESTIDRTVGASFEGYIAPGPGEPYVCLTMEPGLDNRLAFTYNTSYDTFGHRRLEKRDSLDKYRLDTSYREGAVVYTLSFSWENWAEKIPFDGSTYDYEQMVWSRAGNFCWNGTESIHGRSTWGLLKFEISAEQRAKILRRVLANAWAFYRGEKRECGDGYEGALAHWSDPETGDPIFYATEIVPLMSKLDALGALLTVDCDGKTLEKLAREALPLWHNIRFEVARRRGDYLRRVACGEMLKREKLFNGKDLSGWYVKLNGQPKGSDTNKVFTVTKEGTLLVSGDGAGYIATEKEYGDYRLSLEYRFCGKGWYHREHTPADSGLLFHAFGPDGAVDGGTWMASYECNIIVGRTGDLIVVGDDNVKDEMSCWAKAANGQWDPRNGKWTEIGKFKSLRNRWAPKKSDKTDKRPTQWPEKGYGEWNRLELVTRGDTATFLLNGQVVNVVERLPRTSGKILLQTELHGIEFRNIEIER